MSKKIELHTSIVDDLKRIDLHFYYSLGSFLGYGDIVDIIKMYKLEI